MINGIRFLNFQGFKGDQRIELDDINLVFGPNSAGKSSIARGLQLMAQSLRGFEKQQPALLPVFDGDQMNVRPENLIFGRGLDPNIEFGFGVQVRSSLGARAWFSFVLDAEGQIFNVYEFSREDDSEGKPIQMEVKLDLDDLDRSVITIKAESIAPLLDWFRGFDDPIALLKDVEANIFIDLESHYKSLYPNLHSALSEYGGEGIWSKSDEYHEEHQTFVNVIHDFYVECVKDFDDIPEYLTLERDLSAAELLLRKFLHFVLKETLSAATRGLSDLEIVDPVRIVPEGLNSFDVFPREVISSVSSNLLSVTDGRYSVDQVSYRVQDRVEHFWEVVDHFTGISSGLENVGQGITQILEVLVVLELAEGLIVLQQPDLHLHPKAVGKLADILFHKISDDIFSTKSLIIETHSESLLTRLQKHRRISSSNPDLSVSDVGLKVFYSEAVPPLAIDAGLVQDLIDLGADHSLVQQIEGRMSGAFDLHKVNWTLVPPLSDEVRTLMASIIGFNNISVLRVDHVGDVVDPFPVSFADLRVQDLLQ